MPRMNSTPQKYARPTNVFKTLARLFKYFGKKKYLLIQIFWQEKVSFNTCCNFSYLHFFC